MNFKLVPKGFLRAAIICTLEKEQLNGYRIMKRIREITGFWDPSPGSVYPLLKTMRKEGIIKKNKEGFYELTEKGRKLAKKLKITQEQWKTSFIEYLSTAIGIEKDIIEKEIEKRKRIFKDLEPRIRKIFEGIIQESLKLQKNPTTKKLCVEILEEALEKLRKIKSK